MNYIIPNPRRYNVEITMYNGEKFVVGTYTSTKAEAVAAARESYRGHKHYKGIKA